MQVFNMEYKGMFMHSISTNIDKNCNYQIYRKMYREYNTGLLPVTVDYKYIITEVRFSFAPGVGEVYIWQHILRFSFTPKMQKCDHILEPTI